MLVAFILLFLLIKEVKGLYIFRGKQDVDLALEQLEHSLALREKFGAKPEIISTTMQIAMVLSYGKGELDRAIKYLEHGMTLAKEIQFNLLPKAMPEISGYDAYGISIPAKEVGGDYYDMITIEEDCVALCLGDVSGKGMPAALLMANLQATLRGQTMACDCARECLERSNHLLYHSTDAEKYATLFYGILNVKNHMLCFANAGHNNPFLVSQKGKVERLKTIGIPLGFMEQFEFSEHSVALEPGDILVLFSDGISEAMNAFEEEFEEERLLQIVQGGHHLSMRDLVDEIIAAVKNFTGDTPQTDDMTLLALKRNI